MEIENTWASSRERIVRDKLKASTVLAVASPFAIGAAGVVYGMDRGNPIFTQQRVGHNGELFTLQKIRTMPVGTPETSSDGHHDSRRTNKFAKSLSTIRLDEIPQLTNVLRGDMAIVGWRPPLKAEFEDIMDASSPSEQKELQSAMRASWPGFTDNHMLSLHEGLEVYTPEGRREAIIDFATNTSKEYDAAVMRRSTKFLVSLAVQEVQSIFLGQTD